MQQDAELSEVASGNILKVFLKFTIPSMFGFIAMTSASFVDAYFVANYINKTALGGVNIIWPMYSFVFGVVIMVVIGSSVMVGKYIGESNNSAASDLFTKILIILIPFALILTITCFIFNVPISKALGANEDLLPYASNYLKILGLFFLFMVLTQVLMVFVRIDGNPYLSSAAVIVSAFGNFFLDYLFVAKLEYGIEGAALATGLANVIAVLLLLSHFVLRKGTLKFKLMDNNWKPFGMALYNGSSEMLSEMSAGFIALLINWIMILKIGTEGVEAFAIINYTIWAATMLAYSIVDSSIPMMSINFGAKKYNRVKTIIIYTIIAVLMIDVTIFSVLTYFPEKIIAFFLDPADVYTFGIALEFASYIKYSFLLSGVTIVLSGYFTAHQQPLSSVIIASTRGYIMPAITLLALPQIFGNVGIFVSLPISEFITFIVAISLMRIYLKKQKQERTIKV